MLSKRLDILHVYEKRLQNCFDSKTGAISSTCPEIYPKKTAKRSYVDFLENCICGDKNITHLDYGGNNLSHPYTYVFGKIFVAASVIVLCELRMSKTAQRTIFIVLYIFAVGNTIATRENHLWVRTFIN